MRERTAYSGWAAAVTDGVPWSSVRTPRVDVRFHPASSQGSSPPARGAVGVGDWTSVPVQRRPSGWCSWFPLRRRNAFRTSLVLVFLDLLGRTGGLPGRTVPSSFRVSAGPAASSSSLRDRSVWVRGPLSGAPPGSRRGTATGASAARGLAFRSSAARSGTARSVPASSRRRPGAAPPRPPPPRCRRRCSASRGWAGARRRSRR